jgi:type VI secretion system Hcp family effector
MKWLIPLIAIGICCLFVGGLILVVELNQANTENQNGNSNSNGGSPVLGSVGTPGSPVYASGNVQLFMKVQDPSQVVSGESQDAKHRGWIELTAYNWTVTLPQSNGRVVGSAMAANFMVTAETSKASPILLQDCVNGRQMMVTIAVQSTDSSGNAVDICTWKLSDTVIASFNANTGLDGGSRVYDVINFMPSKIELTVTPINADGSLGSPVATAWDCTRSKA